MQSRANQSSASRGALALGAATLFFLSFLMSGSANVLPQLFYQRFYPKQKALLLALTLFVSTMSALAGVAASRRRRSGRGGVLLGLGATTAAVLAFLSIQQAALYIALISFVQFADNYLLNQVDHAAVARTDEHNREFNDVIGNVFRLLGMLAAPPFFTTFSGNSPRVVVGALGAVACTGVAVLFRTETAEAGPGDAIASAPLDRADRLLFAYAISIYVALYLFAANMIYLLGDLLRMPEPELRGGRAIVAVFIAAAVVNGVAGMLRRSSGEDRKIGAEALSAPALALILAGGLLVAGVKPSFAVFLLFSALVGGAYGLFLLELRGYVSRGARLEGKTLLLTKFNNMANVSAAIAFGLMIGLALARSRAPGALYEWTLALIGGVPAAGLALLVLARRNIGPRNLAAVTR